MDAVTGAGDRDLRAELLGRATALRPRLAERAAQAERLRRMPDETVKDLVASELIRIGNPPRHGGHSVDLDAAYDVAWELGRAFDCAGSQHVKRWAGPHASGRPLETQGERAPAHLHCGRLTNRRTHDTRGEPGVFLDPCCGG